MRDERIQTNTGKTIGIIRYSDNGDQIAFNYPEMRILGYYRKNLNVTTTLTGTIIARGNVVSALLFFDKDKLK